MSKKFGVHIRQALIERITATDPELAEELIALRSRHPQGFRKRMKRLAKEYPGVEPERGRAVTAERLGVADTRQAQDVVPPPPEEEQEELPATEEEALAVLGKSIGVLLKELGTGRYDAFLKAMLFAEEGRKNRHGAKKAITKRMG